MILTEGHNIKHIAKAVTAFVTVLFMFSCQNEELDSKHITLYPVIESEIETVVQTRANLLEGYTECPVADRQAYFAKAIAFNSTDNRDNSKDKQGVFVPLNNGWRSTLEVEPNYNYDLYVYSRSMPCPQEPVFDYGNGSNAKLTFSNGMYLITTDDPQVCVAANGALLPDNPNDSRYPTLTPQQFNIGTVTTGEENGNPTKTMVFLAMDHLYSKATLSFCVDATYSQLRDIRVKNVVISTTNGTLTGTHVYTFSNNKFVYDTQGSITGNSIEISLFNGPTATVQPDENAEYVTLTTILKEFGHFCFLPKNPLQSMKLAVTYDVCDKKGNVVRANQTAINDHIFDKISDNGHQAERGTNYQINITVSPSYLYQLSDDDVELGLTIVQQ